MGKSSNGETNMDKLKFILAMKIKVVCTLSYILVILQYWDNFIEAFDRYYFLINNGGIDD